MSIVTPAGNKPTNCKGTEGTVKLCLEDEGNHLSESLPPDGIPSKPVSNDFHRQMSQPHCNEKDCGQRIQIITMQGHEIRMMDDPSEASNISITTSDASQHLRLDEMNKITWLTSHKHHFVMCDQGHAKINEEKESAEYKYVDPNDFAGRLNTSSYMLLQTEKKHQLWLADTPECPRVHAYTIKGHELLLLDEGPKVGNRNHNEEYDTNHNNNESSYNILPGRIQLTTWDKLMQIVMDLDTGEITITNNNEEKNGSIKVHSMKDIEFHAKENIRLFAGNDITESENREDIPQVPGPITPSVDTNLVKVKKNTY